MRNQVIAFAIVSATSWFVACGTEPIQSTGSNNKDGGSGSSTPGSGGGGSSGSGNTGGTGGTTGGGAGTGGAAGSGGGMGGTGGTGGTAGINTGGGGSGGIPVVTSLCDNKPKKALPFNIANDYRVATIIGSDATFHQVPNPDCGGATSEPSSVEAGTEAGTDAGTADSADESQPTASDAAADVSAADVSVTDATSTEASSVDGPVEAGPPPACYAFTYDPAFCEAAECWSGVIFQVTPVSGAGGVGICIEPGATKIEFWAKASRDMARIKFGSIRPGLGQTEFFLMITTVWTKYTVTIPAGDMYNETTTSGGVWNGFSAVVEPGDHAGGTTFAIKDIVWIK